MVTYVHRYLNAIIPIRFQIQRPFQPVPEIAEKIGALLNLPVYTDYLIKVKQTQRAPVRDLPAL